MGLNVTLWAWRVKLHLNALLVAESLILPLLTPDLEMQPRRITLWEVIRVTVGELHWCLFWHLQQCTQVYRLQWTISKENLSNEIRLDNVLKLHKWWIICRTGYHSVCFDNTFSGLAKVAWQCVWFWLTIANSLFFRFFFSQGENRKILSMDKGKDHHGVFRRNEWTTK